MKEESKQYWFKRRRWGIGYVPATWQGWAVILVYAFVMIIGSFVLLGDTASDPSNARIYIFLGFIVLSAVLTIAIAMAKGPRPAKWRWGKKPDDNPEEDF